MSSSLSPNAPPTKSPATRPAGRPTKEETSQLTEDVHQAALALFLDHGYEGTSLDAIARDAGTTKASLYVRYVDKGSLFVGVVEWAIERAEWPVPLPQEVDLDDLEGALRSIATATVRRVTHPSMVGLTRIVAAQAGRFPDLARSVSAANWGSAALVVKLLARHAADGTIVANEPDILAEQFLGLVAGTPERLATFGVDRDQETQRHHTDVALDLFLRGVRPG